MKKVYRGNIVFIKKMGELTSIKNGYLVVENGVIVSVDKVLSREYENLEIVDFGNKLIIPGFVDIHLHAPQINNLGLGADLELLDWLEKYTFPEEAKYRDLNYTEKSYSTLINKLWENGTTSSIIFGSIFKDSNILLSKMISRSGLKAYVGKVNMDKNSPDYYIEETEQSLIDTEDYINEISKLKNIRPIITPRFVPSCSKKLMYGLGELAKKYDLKIQSHLSENIGEVEWVKELHPDCENYIDVYEKYNLLRKDKVVMAHCVWSNKEEIKKLKEYNITVAHAPVSNGNLASGIAPINEFKENRVNIGLCSDLSGGHELFLGKVIKEAETFGKLKWINDKNKYNYLTTLDYFYFATKGSGKFFGNVGSLEENYDADFLVIDDSDLSDLNDRSLDERLKRFIYLGNGKNIIARYVNGIKIEKPF
ncbi:amidohydrolase family protein [Miniphocaeibacter halophilus]|uniref:Amidohydrolase family protein n=1 Tax=Miniphocaeibacter halophilus TaxID=2931922 RepID=A0AC61MQC9_9FIRM|nr:amidohydrolase family protein [Miniphocaeibacter halophilus]QQK07809.1 amidohydrolase family protein [Miniphocaeibacter halophilus]